MPKTEWKLGTSHRTKEEWREDKYQLGQLRDYVNDLLAFGGTRTYPRTMLGKEFVSYHAVPARSRLDLVNCRRSSNTPPVER